eukprot:3934340-Rhodomonas_salina.1
MPIDLPTFLWGGVIGSYVLSPNCNKEYHTAISNGKFLIPVLLDGWSDTTNSHSSLWYAPTPAACPTRGAVLRIGMLLRLWYAVTSIVLIAWY